MLLKEKEAKAVRMRKKKGSKGRKEGSAPGLEGIVSVMFNNLQLATGGLTSRSKEFVVCERLAKFFGQKTRKGLQKGNVII